MNKVFWSALGFMLAVNTLSAGSMAADVKDYLTGEIKHLQAIKGVANMHDAQVVTSMGSSARVVESLASKKGKVLLVTFWDTDCLRCRSHLRQLQAVQEKLGKDTVEVIALHSDDRTLAGVQNYLNRRKLSGLTAYLDYGDRTVREVLAEPTYNLFGAQPKTLIVDPKGEVRALSNFRRDWLKPEAIAFLKALHSGDV